MSNDKTFTRGDKVTYFGREADGGEGMSDDLVSRLRRAVTWQGVVPHGNQLARQAADEIERLRALLDGYEAMEKSMKQEASG